MLVMLVYRRVLYMILTVGCNRDDIWDDYIELHGVSWNIWNLEKDLMGATVGFCKTRFITTPEKPSSIRVLLCLSIMFKTHFCKTYISSICFGETLPYRLSHPILTSMSSHKYPWGQWSCHMVKAGWIFRCALALDTAMMKCFMERFQRIGTLSWGIWKLNVFLKSNELPMLICLYRYRLELGKW